MAIQTEPFVPFGPGAPSPTGDVTPEYLGGKGYGLVKMAQEGYPVPPGFVIPTILCPLFQDDPQKVIDAVMADLPPYLQWLEEHFGYKPLLSVRSGAPISMPGMMDTILNVGMGTTTIGFWKGKLNDRAAYDSYRRMLQMLGTTAFGMPAERFEQNMEATKAAFGVKTDQDMTAEMYQSVCKRHWTTYKALGNEVPDTLDAQLRASIRAVFSSWNSPRAKHYRKMEGISEDMGTAVVIQAMVFGNMNDESGSGVMFSRDPATGEPTVVGEFLANAQGEDVVAGIRTPIPLSKMEDSWPLLHTQLVSHAMSLEASTRDMVDIEFTIQDGKLYLLQTRTGKRAAPAAFKIAVDMYDEGKITRKEVIERVSVSQYVAVSKPILDPSYKGLPAGVGIPASPGVVTGIPVFSAQDAINCKEPCILVTEETTPDDIAGMEAAVGILTRTGGATSHAAVVARGMNKPCVVGLTDLLITPTPGILTIKNMTVASHQKISIDGATGRMWFSAVPVIDSSMNPSVNTFFDMLFEETGLMEKTDQPKANAMVVTTDWYSRGEFWLNDAMETLYDLDQNGAKLLIDVTPPDMLGDETDTFMWKVGGAVPEQKMFWENVVVRLRSLGLENTQFTTTSSAIKATLEKGGLISVSTVNTVFDLWSTDQHVMLGEKLKEALGATPEETREALSRLKDAGPSAKVLPEPMYRADAAFAVLRSA